MPMIANGTERWQVSTRGRGEVLAARAAAPGLDLALLGSPAGYSPAELESWLESLARAVVEGSEPSPPGDPVPSILRQALGGLLFSHAELWRGGSEAPCSLAMAYDGERIAFGWVGEASVEVYLDGARTTSEWVSVRDAQGREGRAWCGVPGHEVRIVLAWTPRSDADAVSIEAQWSGPRAALAATGAAPLPAETEPAAIAEPTRHAGEGDPPSTGVARWLAQHVKWDLTESAEATAAAPEAGTAARPSEEAREAGESPSDSAPGNPQAPAGEIEPSGSRSVSLPALDAESPALDLPESIPPTPEPEALTAQTVDVDPPASRRAPPRHPEWPAPALTRAPRAPIRWKWPVLIAASVLVLFGVGWMLGSTQGPEGPAETRRPSALVLFLRQVGLAPPRFSVAVRSRPEGAWISLDGKDLSARAPATLELPPGQHRIDLSFPDLGKAGFTVKGAKNERLALDAPLWGAIDVVATDVSAVVSVALDGAPLGFVPIRIDSVAPGPHELRFSGPGMASWGSTIEVRIGESREVLAYPLQSPATGLLQIRATRTTEGETQPLEGARVWVDREAKGTTPLTIELARGPHSVKVAYQNDAAPVQVIDLPGGNQRFATFDFGLRAEFPTLLLKAPEVMAVEEPALISATLTDVAASDVREMWLHVRGSDTRWRRYPMTLMNAQGSVVGAAPFPVVLIGPEGRTIYYVSALTSQGDEYFTEMQPARAAPSR